MADITLPEPQPTHPIAACGCGSGCSCGCQSGGSCSCGGNCG
ncbi:MULTISPECIES: hypothetical protein [Streptomyces]|nr:MULTISPECIES: hypothetical protein [Streptomyces]